MTVLKRVAMVKFTKWILQYHRLHKKKAGTSIIEHSCLQIVFKVFKINKRNHRNIFIENILISLFFLRNEKSGVSLAKDPNLALIWLFLFCFINDVIITHFEVFASDSWWEKQKYLRRRELVSTESLKGHLQIYQIKNDEATKCFCFVKIKDETTKMSQKCQCRCFTGCIKMFNV